MRTPRILILVLFLVACLFLLCRFITVVAGPETLVSSSSSSTVAPNRASSPMRMTTTPLDASDASDAPDAAAAERLSSSSSSPQSRISALFTFNSGFSLFSPNAAISLTDDNSTSFPAQPAAFGPSLPHRGLSGQLWVGSPFTDDNLREDEGEGELGCGDIPGWEDHKPNNPAAHQRPHAGSDDAPVAAQTNAGSDADIMDGLKLRRDLRKTDIEGKIVLLSRGGCGFYEKVMWAQRRGATALIVGDNQKGRPLIQMYARGDTSNVTIPSVFTARTTAHLLSSLTQPGSFIQDTTDEDGNPALRVLHSAASKSKAKHESDSSAVEKKTTSTASFTNPFARAVPRDVTPASTRSTSDKQSWLRGLLGWQDNSPSADRTITPETDEQLISEAMVPAHMNRARSAPILSAPIREVPSGGHDGLWVTITPSNSGNPFFDTLLVLVISPLITLTIVYSLLLIRARIRRRRWRAPKSVVERLPVRTYHTVAPSPVLTPRVPSPISDSPTDPLLSETTPPASRPRSRTTTGVPEADERSAQSSTPKPQRSEREKAQGTISSEWKKYMSRQVECVVCLEEYVDGVSQVMSLPCGHEFHADCITPWLTTRRRTCPICKGDVVRSLARGGTSSPRYEPYHDDSEDEGEDEGGPSGSRDSDDDVEQGIFSPTPRRRPTRAEAWLGRLSNGFGATTRSAESLQQDRDR